MNEQKNISEKFLQLTSMAFTFAILANAIFGRVFDGDGGIPFHVVFQILILAVVNSGIALFVTNAKIFGRLLTLWQLIITMFACLTATIPLVIVFRLIPLYSLAAWVAFIIGFVISFIVVSAIIIIKIKLDEKRYNRQLSNYKENQKHD